MATNIYNKLFDPRDIPDVFLFNPSELTKELGADEDYWSAFKSAVNLESFIFTGMATLDERSWGYYVVEGDPDEKYTDFAVLLNPLIRKADSVLIHRPNHNYHIAVSPLAFNVLANLSALKKFIAALEYLGERKEHYWVFSGMYEQMMDALNRGDLVGEGDAQIIKEMLLQQSL